MLNSNLDNRRQDVKPGAYWFWIKHQSTMTRNAGRCLSDDKQSLTRYAEWWVLGDTSQTSIWEEGTDLQSPATNLFSTEQLNQTCH